MEGEGFTVKGESADDLNAIKKQYQVPEGLEACHTAIVDGYVIEGHVPAADIKRLLTERPKILGLAVAGMPAGSPGMAPEGSAPTGFDVIAFDEAGNTSVFTSYP